MQVVFIMEYLEGGELLRYLNEKKLLSEEEAKHFFLQIISAVSYVHKEQLIHRDLKLENLLLTDSGGKTIKGIGEKGREEIGGKEREEEEKKRRRGREEGGKKKEKKVWREGRDR